MQGLDDGTQQMQKLCLPFTNTSFCAADLNVTMGILTYLFPFTARLNTINSRSMLLMRIKNNNKVVHFVISICESGVLLMSLLGPEICEATVGRASAGDYQQRATKANNR